MLIVDSPHHVVHIGMSAAQALFIAGTFINERRSFYYEPTPNDRGFMTVDTEHASRVRELLEKT
jgi:hypothetical protein